MELSSELKMECKNSLTRKKLEMLRKFNLYKMNYFKEIDGGINLNSNDLADQASKIIECSSIMTFLNHYRKLYREIEDALKRIRDGNYGFCEITNELIDGARLKIVPWARYSVEGHSYLLQGT